jgi:hypothetical protein
MGDISDMMLDGTLCECCGVYLGESSQGDFPQLCRSCAKEAREARQNALKTINRCAHVVQNFCG